MRIAIRSRFTLGALTDPVQRRQGQLIQAIMLLLLFTSSIGTITALTAPAPEIARLVNAVPTALLFPLQLIGLVLLWRGAFRNAVMLCTLGLTLYAGLLLYCTGISAGASIMLAMVVPIVLAGLLTERHVLLLVIGLSLGLYGLALVGELLELPLAGISAPQSSSLVGYTSSIVLVVLLLGVCLDRSGQILREALTESRRQAEALSLLSDTLEQTVAERTAELRAALEDNQRRATEQMRLLEQTEQQQQTIRELSVPVLPINTTTLVMPLIGDIDSERMAQIQRQSLDAISRSSARRLLLDITGVPLVDTQVAQGLMQVVSAAQLLGAEVVLVGLRPEVAQAIVGLGLDLQRVRSFSDIQNALLRMNNERLSQTVMRPA